MTRTVIVAALLRHNEFDGGDADADAVLALGDLQYNAGTLSN
jgi:hypothetical protein